MRITWLSFQSPAAHVAPQTNYSRISVGWNRASELENPSLFSDRQGVLVTGEMPLAFQAYADPACHLHPQDPRDHLCRSAGVGEQAKGME